MEQIYKAKPQTITAVQYNGFNDDEIKTFCCRNIIICEESHHKKSLKILNGNENLLVEIDDYVIKDDEGKFSVENKDEFFHDFEKQK